MTPLKTGAIALTLILVIPIMLGYAMATEETTMEVETSEKTGSLNDAILNAQSPYYTTYGGVNNNEHLLRTVTSGDTITTSLINPDYNQTSADNPTFTPIFGTLDGSLALSSVDLERTYNGGSVSTTDPFDDITVDNVLPDFAVARLYYSPDGSQEFDVAFESVYGGYYSETFTSGPPITIVRTSSGSYEMSGINDNGVETHIDIVDFYFTVTGYLRVAYADYTDLPLDSLPSEWFSSGSDYISLVVTYPLSNGVIARNTFAYHDATGLYYNNGTFTISHGGHETTLTGVTAIRIAQDIPFTTFDYTYSPTTPINYADVSYGWTIPTPDGDYDSYRDVWMNGFDNSYVRMMIHIETGQILDVGSSLSHIDDGVPALRVSSIGGLVYLYFPNSTNTGLLSVLLGQYTDLMIEIRSTSDTEIAGNITVTGISSWPSFGTMPEYTYNVVSRDVSNEFSSDFTTIYLKESSLYDAVDIRIDATEIVAGTYPCTEDYTINLTTLFPSTLHQSVVIDSVGVYGKSLVFGGNTYNVEDGKITVDGKSIPVKDMTVSYELGSGGYIVSVNGVEVGVRPNATLYFGGEWSLTLHREVITTETVTATEWVPGEFAFTQDDFILCMILTTVLVFVGLGLMRGVKIGVLAVVCSAAGIIAFMIV